VFPIKVQPLAEKQIREATFWYESQQNGLGLYFTNKLEQGLSFLRQTPKSFLKRYEDVRTSYLKTFPCIVHYTFENGLVNVHAAIHAASHPKNWKNE